MRVLFNNSTKKVIYELVNTANFLKFLPQIVFPIFNSRFRYQTEKILTYKDLADRNLFSETDTDFIYLQMNGNRLEEIDIQEESAINIINKINLNEYSLDGKETTKKALTNVRLNTQNLRSFALARDNSKCLLCDINTDDFLICSHIKPWQTGQARLDLNNVLTLCRFHDALFDKGYISIDNNGDIINSNQDIVNKDTTRSLLSVSNSRVKRIINSRMKKYLEYHRANVYKG
jgi:predicted restriction endonuclease